MNYDIDLKSIIKEVKSNKDTDLGDIEEIKRRVKEKIDLIRLNYNKYLFIDIGFNMKRMAIALTYRHDRKNGLLALEKYLDELLEDYLNNGNILSLKEL